MTKEKVNSKGELLASLDDTISEAVQLVSLFSEKEINTIPFKDSWTAAQCTDHIIKVILSVTKTLIKEGTVTDRNPDERAEELKKIFFDFNAKFQSPEFVKPLEQIYALESLNEGLKASVDKIKEAGININSSEIIKHPVLGELTKLEMLHFVLYHTQRHIHQLKKILKAVKTSDHCIK